jgi:hypothetical protein
MAQFRQAKRGEPSSPVPLVITLNDEDGFPLGLQGTVDAGLIREAHTQRAFLLLPQIAAAGGSEH